jgi:hypothetical protein
MRIFVVCGILLAAVAGTFASVSAASPRVVECGGLKVTYGTSIGSVGTNVHKQYASGIMSIAAVTLDDLHARAWIVWDERAQPWLALAKQSPDDLKRLWIFPKEPDFSGPGIQVRWTYLKTHLPPKYRLTDCPDALPYGK